MTDDEVKQTTVQDLIDTCIGEKPDDFANRFNELMRNRLSATVDGKKVEMSSTLFGTPEGQTDINDVMRQTHDEIENEDDEPDDSNEEEPKTIEPTEE